VTAEPKFLRRLKPTREHSTGWCTPCPDTHAGSGYAVLISLDERAGRYRVTCTEAVNGDLCGNERDLVRLLGLTDAEIRLGDESAPPLRFVPIEDFAAVHEPGAEPLVVVTSSDK
jgi:hypothetical protein